MESLKTLSPECIKLLRQNNLFKRLIKAELIRSKLFSVEIDEEYKKEALRNYWEKNKILNDNEFQNILKEKIISEAEFVESLVMPIKLDKYCLENFEHISKAHFLKRKDYLDQVVYSLIRVKDPFLAKELYLRIAGNEAQFGDLAVQYSEGPEKTTRGIIGPCNCNQGHPDLINFLKKSKPGELSEPIKIKDWHVIIRLESYLPVKLDKEMILQMSREIFDAKLEEEAEFKAKELTGLYANTKK